MQKDFDSWNERKKKIEQRRPRYPKKREVWWADLGVNVGSEQDGTGNLFERPVLVLKKFANDTCLVAPLTKSDHASKFSFALEYNEQKSFAILSQLKTISMKRLRRDIRRLDVDEFNKIIAGIKRIHGM